MLLSEGCFAIPVLNVTVLFLILGRYVEPPGLSPFHFPATVIVFPCFFTFLVALACPLTATELIKQSARQTLCGVRSFGVASLLCTDQCAVDC